MISHEELVLDYPPAGNPDALLHCGGSRANHPAIFLAMLNLITDIRSLLAVPNLIPGILMKITHNHLLG